MLGGETLRADDDQAPLLDQAALDAIRELIPEGEPGEYDITEADAIFGEFAELAGFDHDVADFGDGSQLTGLCGGFAYSYDRDGRLLDAVADLGDDGPPIDLLDGDQAFTASNRFKVDTGGLVTYYGFMPRDGEGPLDHRWTISTAGVSVDSGGDPNTNGNNRNAGIVDLAEQLPVKFSANVTIDGSMRSENLPDCIGKGHVELIGDGLLDPAGLVGIGLLAGGLVGLLFNARPARTWKV